MAHVGTSPHAQHGAHPIRGYFLTEMAEGVPSAFLLKKKHWSVLRNSSRSPGFCRMMTPVYSRPSSTSRSHNKPVVLFFLLPYLIAYCNECRYFLLCNSIAYIYFEPLYCNGCCCHNNKYITFDMICFHKKKLHPSSHQIILSLVHLLGADFTKGGILRQISSLL